MPNTLLHGLYGVTILQHPVLSAFASEWHRRWCPSGTLIWRVDRDVFRHSGGSVDLRFWVMTLRRNASDGMPETSWRCTRTSHPRPPQIKIWSSFPALAYIGIFKTKIPWFSSSLRRRLLHQRGEWLLGFLHVVPNSKKAITGLQCTQARISFTKVPARARQLGRIDIQPPIFASLTDFYHVHYSGKLVDF